MLGGVIGHGLPSSGTMRSREAASNFAPPGQPETDDVEQRAPVAEVKRTHEADLTNNSAF